MEAKNPHDSRQEITDLGLVIFSPDAYKLRCGVEAKLAIPITDELSDAKYIVGNFQVRVAMDQAMD